MEIKIPNLAHSNPPLHTPPCSPSSTPSGKMGEDNENNILGVHRAMGWKEYQFMNNHIENCSALNNPPKNVMWAQN